MGVIILFFKTWMHFKCYVVVMLAGGTGAFGRFPGANSPSGPRWARGLPAV